MADRAVPRAPGGRRRCGTPPPPGAGRPWLVAQFPAPLEGRRRCGQKTFGWSFAVTALGLVAAFLFGGWTAFGIV
ncbi:hypothetical protein, partial [Streptomyces althioticus]|uniref:hypothetical protein n=1 Tax=Streptomyces althioticus TaxID=83380 RepID=UPI003320E42A